jgi:hypothetical protein
LENNLTQLRPIGKTKIETPLLVPSFSSVCDRRIGEIHTHLISHIPDCSLVSAYDLAYDYVDSKKIWASNLVYIDCGNYEYQSLRTCKDGRNWSRTEHYRMLDGLKALSEVVIVNFDEPDSFEEQIKTATTLFQRYPSFASCFLCKPFSKLSNDIDLQTLIQNLANLESIDIIAFTEKELGNSLLERAKKVFNIRQALNSIGMNKPIHIFGCLDPLAIITLFLSGADIFDGTNWLKFAFYDNLTIYTNDYAILSGNWSESDLTVRNSSYVFNLSKLATLSQNMRQYSKIGKLEAFELGGHIQKQISDLVNTAQSRSQ